MRSIITRVVFAVLTVITAFSIALAYNASAQGRLLAELARVNQGFVPISRQLDTVKEEIRSFGRVLTNRDPSALRQSVRASMALFPFTERVEDDLTALREHLDQMLATELTTAERGFITNVRGTTVLLSSESEELGELVDQLLLLLDEHPPRVEPTYGVLGARIIAFEKRVNDLGALVDQRTDDAVLRVAESERSILRRVITVSVVAALFATLVVILIGRSLAPIRALTRLATRLKEGDYRAEPIRAGNDEIGVLAGEFTSMAAAIRERDGILRRKNDELEAAYAALIEAQRAQVQAERLAAVGELSSRVTHELRNPLSSISLNVEMLAEELSADGAETEAREMLGAIEREVTRLTELTERYLSLARADEPRREPVDVSALIREILDRQSAELRQASVRVELVANSPIVAPVDESQVHQVIVNLVRNAIQALGLGDGERALRVTVAATTEHVVCSVEDSGPGVPMVLMSGVTAARAVIEDDGGEPNGEYSAAEKGRSYDAELIGA